MPVRNPRDLQNIPCTDPPRDLVERRFEFLKTIDIKNHFVRLEEKTLRERAEFSRKVLDAIKRTLA